MEKSSEALSGTLPGKPEGTAYLGPAVSTVDESQDLCLNRQLDCGLLLRQPAQAIAVSTRRWVANW